MRNKNLGKKNNDEMYTGMQDILNELSYWAAKDKFVGKRIICPCDRNIADDKDIYGLEVIFDEDSTEAYVFNTVKSVKIIKAVETKLVESYLPKDEIAEFLRDDTVNNFVRTLTQKARRWGIKSITASGFNPATGLGIKFQDVDYSKYDICITNPPFSLYSEFMECILGKIDFICLAPFLNRQAPNVGLPLMLKKAYLGKGRHLGLNFQNPTKENEYHTKAVACDWITSFNDAQLEVDAEAAEIANFAKEHGCQIQYDKCKDEYAVYTEITMKDGTHPIRVPGSQFPDDYDGWMFAPINVLNKLDQSSYEWYGTNFKKYYNTTNPTESPFAHKATNDMLKINGKFGFPGIVFRKKA